VGGYIDGNLTDGDDVPGIDNPSAVGHLVNHPPPGVQANVFVISFLWKEVLQDRSREQMHRDEESSFPIPNKMRSDGSPWYYDATAGNIVRFPLHPRACTHGTTDRHSTPRKGTSGVVTPAGAVLCASRDLKRDEELFLNYNLKGPPFPKWALSWYVPVPRSEVVRY